MLSSQASSLKACAETLACEDVSCALRNLWIDFQNQSFVFKKQSGRGEERLMCRLKVVHVLKLAQGLLWPNG